VKALIDARQFNDALAQLRRLLDLKGEAAARYDRHTLHMLRTECLLNNRDQEGALKTLTSARNEARTQDEMDEAVALTALIHRAPRYTFTPKGAGARPLDILDREQRLSAYKAMWNDAQGSISRQLSADKKYATMAALMVDAEEMATSRAFEYMATGKTTSSGRLAKVLRDKAIRLLDQQLKEMQDSISAAARRANTVITERLVAGTRTRLAGLSASDTAMLESVQAMARQYPAAMGELRNYFVADSDTLAQYSDRAAALASEASRLQRSFR
jgi:hypothetical protein